jgi:hypothetical protein
VQERLETYNLMRVPLHTYVTYSSDIICIGQHIQQILILLIDKKHRCPATSKHLDVRRWKVNISWTLFAVFLKSNSVD